MNVVVILSDGEAANVASILRRMNERVEDAADHTVAYVDDRGPNDFAKQLEALADAGDENVYVPLFTLGEAPAASAAFVTRTDADTYAAKNDVPHVQKVPLFDPDDDVDDTPELRTDGGEDEGPSFFQRGPLAVPIPDHADRSTPLEPPEFDEHAKRCPECDANTDPWVGDDVVGVSFDITVVNGQVAAVVEAACTCGWEDRTIVGADA